ncbi:Fur family transcriptional regulator [Enterocloster clostridioformis]|uniref:Fur family transcriptional regulator, ferric uptake regulator n=1 Tax=[Clostridium] clostridioforme 90A8 TaxID=999408 RepID=A0A0E2HEW8_9FIRM|nr:transcriptional repressor [Enterocloster clostridioformis]ENZ05314.1 hypothetical protein HMPREF1090_05689 [[Clostridium] clostridioforme 90A8]
MAQKAQYKTKQMKELLSYLESVRGNHVTVGDIYTHFESEGITVGTTTIYRHLERMVEQGIVVRYVIDGTNSACFEYVGERADGRQPVSFHCKCKKCGKLIHLQCNEAENLGQHMLEHHDFEMDSRRTVFYGICGDCRGSKS